MLLFILGSLMCITDASHIHPHDRFKAVLSAYSKLSRPNPLKTFYRSLNGTMRLLKCVTEGTHFVEVKLNVEKLSNFNIKSQGFEATMTTQMRWFDSNLFDLLFPMDITPFVDDIWVPDIVFVNARESSTEGSQNSLTSIHVEYKIMKMEKTFKLKVYCDLDLKSFPFDRQSCDITLGSFGSKRSDMDLVWWTHEELDIFGLDRDHQKVYNDAVNVETTSVGEMKLEKFTARYCGHRQTSCLKVNLTFKRSAAYYLAHVYMPSTFIVLLSWQAFYINPEDAAVRMSIGMLSVFALVMQTSSLSKKLPVLPYFNAIDIWLIGCQIQILTYIILFVFVHLRVNAKKSRLQRKIDNRNKINTEIKIRAYMAIEKFDLIKVIGSNFDKKIKQTKLSSYAEYCWTNTTISMEAVDSMSRILFPLLFILYTGFYIALVVR